MRDHDFVVQGIYSDGRISEETGSNDEMVARTMAKDMLSDLGFEGEYVRIITRDGELVYDNGSELSGNDLHNIRDNIKLARQILNNLHHDVATPWIKQRIHDAQQNLLAANALLIGKKV